VAIQHLEGSQRQDLHLIRGDSFFKEFWFSECDDDVLLPLDFSGYTARAEIRRLGSTRSVVEPSASITDAANGEITVEMTTVQTNLLRPGSYVWLLIVEADEDPQENTYTLLSGAVTVVDRQDLINEDLDCGCS
jgi:hypothetical protein